MHTLIKLTFALFLLLALLAFARWALWPSSKLPRRRVRVMRLRLHLRLHPGRGHATVLELWRRWGRFASFRESARTRPSLTFWQRARRPQSHSLYLGRAQYRHTLRVTVQEHGCLIGPPRSWKSALLSRLTMAAPGAAVSTSSKPDMFALTSGVRASRGPVHVFNPQGIGGIPSTFRWSPIDGCAEAATAIRRGNAFAQAIGTKGTEDASFWSTTAGGCLRAMFAAAALAHGDMRLVTQWVRAERTEAALGVLEAAGRPDEAGSLGILVGRAEKTAETVRAVLHQAVAYMADPALADATLPGPGCGFDIDSFLLSGGTLYMIAKGQDGDCTLAPLFAALASEIQWRATQLASRMPGGRMDPPLLLALDEVTQICPIPLPYWLADSGGQGVSVWTAFHGRAQLVSRWKEAGAQTVMDTSNVRVYMPGLADADVLDHASRLSGDAAYRDHGGDGWTRHAVLSPDMIRMLPGGWALAQRGPHSPVVFKVAKGWRDRAYRKARRQGRATASILPASLQALAPPAEALLDAAEAGAAIAAADPFPSEAWLASEDAPAEACLVPDADPAEYPWSTR